MRKMANSTSVVRYGPMVTAQIPRYLMDRLLWLITAIVLIGGVLSANACSRQLAMDKSQESVRREQLNQPDERQNGTCRNDPDFQHLLPVERKFL
jgi:cytochrome c-type biogenesis protein CcmH/NrfF